MLTSLLYASIAYFVHFRKSVVFTDTVIFNTFSGFCVATGNGNLAELVNKRPSFFGYDGVNNIEPCFGEILIILRSRLRNRNEFSVNPTSLPAPGEETDISEFSLLFTASPSSSSSTIAVISGLCFMSLTFVRRMTGRDLTPLRDLGLEGRT